MMIVDQENCRGRKLHKICFVIGYLHLASSVLDIVFQVLTVAFVTDGFQCDFDYDTFNSIPWSIVEPILLILNLGTHGFYPFPGILRREYTMYTEHAPTAVATEPKCYSGMLHLDLIVVLYFVINLIWLKIVISYVGALHKKNPDSMRMFFSISLVKVVLQVMHFGYQPHLYNVFAPETYWFLKVLDIFIAIIFLVFVQKYIKVLRTEIALAHGEKPPPYIECLINAGVIASSNRSNEVIVYDIIDEIKPVETEKKPPEDDLKAAKIDNFP